MKGWIKGSKEEWKEWWKKGRMNEWMNKLIEKSTSAWYTRMEGCIFRYDPIGRKLNP